MSIYPIIPADIIYSINDKQDILVSDKFDDLNEKEKITSNIIKRNTTPILVYEWEGRSFPIQFSGRHGGLGLSLYKMINMMIAPQAFALWHAFFKMIVVLFFYLGLSNFISKKKAFWGIALFSIEPIFLTSYFVFISELINLASMSFLFYLISRNKRMKNYELLGVGVLVGLNLATRLNFLWMIVWLIPLLLTNKTIRECLNGRKLLIFIIGGLLGGVPFFYQFDLIRLLGEASNVAQSWSPKYLFWYTFKMMFSPLAYNEYFIEKPHTSFIVVEIIISLMLLWKFFRSNQGVFDKKIVLGTVLSLLTIYICTRAGKNYFLYLTFLIVPIYFLILNRKVNMYLLSGLILLRAGVFAIGYYQSGVMEIFDYKLNKEVWSKVSKYKNEDIINISDSEHGKGNFFGHDLKIYNINRYFSEYENMTLNLALALFDHDGVLVIPQKDIWGAWFQMNGPFVFEKFKEMARRDGIEIIEYQYVSSKENSGYYIINYKLRK